MKSKHLYLIFLLGFLFSCNQGAEQTKESKDIFLEEIRYYTYPLEEGQQPFKYRLTYNYDNGKPHRWMELDSLGKMMTDYIYSYDDNWKHTGASYREDGNPDFSFEKVQYRDDSTKITEWLDSAGNVFYTMIDNLNQQKKTYRAEFRGEETHGFDSTFYTSEGFVSRVFFTNMTGKVFNDRSFVYDSINQYGDWVLRKKIMGDTIREIHKRIVQYYKNYVSSNGKYYEGILTTGELSENVISFSYDEQIVFLTRTSGWNNQSAFVMHKRNGLFTEAIKIDELDSIYNGAISPKADKILYCVRKDDHEEAWFIQKENGKWTNRVNLTETSNIKGGYFYWFNDQDVYFYQSVNNGDIVFGELKGEKLLIKDSLSIINTINGTEFSPYVDKMKRFMIFSRYEEGSEDNQGFFVSYNQGSLNSPEWSRPEKLSMLPYGWNAYIVNNGKLFIYSDGEDFRALPVEALKLDFTRI